MRSRFLVPGIAAAIWLAIVLAGMGVLMVYGATPGAAATPPVTWPTGSAIAASSRSATAIVFLHPHCPCSRATLEELQRIMVEGITRARWYAVFVLPAGAPAAWEAGSLIHAAESIPGLIVHRDQDGVEAQRFSAATSGQVVHYDTDGRLVFSGGITGSRGHAGDNDGRRALVAIVQDAHPRVRRTPVYGCPLLNAAACCDDSSCREDAACRL